jgi:hypothetical protein
MRALLKREVGILLRAPATWLILTLAALLVGHGFVLALDLFIAASRSAQGHQLMRRELDPLLGIVRPTLGGLQLAGALLLPVIAARPLSMEKERRSYAALTLRVASTPRVILAKLVAAWVGAGLLLGVPLLLLLAFAIAGGHVWLPEVSTAFAGYALFLSLVATISVAAAAATSSFAQAAALGMLVSLTSWAIEASEGFSALAWLARLGPLSVGMQLARFELGVFSLGGAAWLACGIIVAASVAVLQGQLSRSWRVHTLTLLLLIVWLPCCAVLGSWQRAFDSTESKRMSLPLAAVAALRARNEPLRLTLWLERDDARRTQLERDVLAKLRLARPDLEVYAPLDDPARATGLQHGVDYGWIEIHAGASVRRTRSTSRKEVTTLLFEALGQPLPAWSQSVYPGYPWIPSPSTRTVLALLAYAVLPLACASMGAVLTRWRKAT